MKKVDLSKLTITAIDGKETVVDFAKELAQTIFQNTQSIEEHTFSLELYKNPIVELTERNKEVIKNYTDCHFKAFVQIAVNKLLKD